RRCLEKDRDLRFQSARDLAFNLETMSSMVMPSSTLSQPMPQHGVPSTPSPSQATYTPTIRTATPTAHRPPMTSATAAHPTEVRNATMARPRTVLTKPKPRVSPILTAIFFIVAVAGAAFGGWWFALHGKGDQQELTFRRITFRRGEVRGARFTPDGDTIVYSAAWEGQPSALYVASRQSTEARPLGINDAELLAVSKTSELAIMLRRDRMTGIGTLARIPLAGGMPREVSDSALRADWMPDGSLAALRIANGKYRIEAPVGTVQYDTQHQILDMRIAPDGRIAFVETISGKNILTLLDNKKADPIAIGWSHGVTGIAWGADGKSILLTGTDSGAPPALYSVTLAGDVHLSSRLTGLMRLYDVSGAGRVLLANGMWRAALEYQPPGETTERDVSWLDWSIATDLSPDGKTIL